jgi:hypothetical protein
MAFPGRPCRADIHFSTAKNRGFAVEHRAASVSNVNHSPETSPPSTITLRRLTTRPAASESSNWPSAIFVSLHLLPLSRFSLSHPFPWLAGVLLVRSAFLRLSALCLFFPLSFGFFFLLSYPLSLFRVPGRHFLYRGQNIVVRSILLKPPQGSVIQFEPDSAFFHELGDPVRRDAILNQIANVIEGKRFLSLSERWQRVNNQEKYRQNSTPAHCTNCSLKISIHFQTGMRGRIL